MTNLVAVTTVPDQYTLSDEAMDYISNSKADNTKRSYSSDWADFTAYCLQHGVNPLPADLPTIIDYLTDLARTAKVSTINRRATSISQAHQAKGYQSPTHSLPVRALLRGIRKAKGTAQKGKAALLTHDIRAMIAALPNNTIGSRDKALLLLGFAGAFRRSEIASLRVDDLTFGTEGITVLLRRSKTDQEGEGRKIGIPYGNNPDTCPVKAAEDWLQAAGITEGSLFRSVNKGGRVQSTPLCDKAIALIVKRTAEAAGLNPDEYAGHSLRAGLATSAAMAGVEERVIMKQTGHKSVNMVRKYIRDGSLFRENAASQVGL
jgi:integrase